MAHCCLRLHLPSPASSQRRYHSVILSHNLRTHNMTLSDHGGGPGSDIFQIPNVVFYHKEDCANASTTPHDRQTNLSVEKEGDMASTSKEVSPSGTDTTVQDGSSSEHSIFARYRQILRPVMHVLVAIVITGYVLQKEFVCIADICTGGGLAV